MDSARNPIRVLIAKVGLDGHDRGVKIVARTLRDAGMDVIYEGIRLTPAEIVSAAKEKKAHAVGLSILSGSHLDLVQEVVRLMRAEGLENVPLIVGGIIPPVDALALKSAMDTYRPLGTTSTWVGASGLMSWNARA